MSKTKAAQDWSGSIVRSWFFLHLQAIACVSRKNSFPLIYNSNLGIQFHLLSQTSKWLLPFFSFFCALDIIRQCFTWAFCNIPKSTPPPKNQPFPWCFKQEYKAKSYLSIWLLQSMAPYTQLDHRGCYKPGKGKLYDVCSPASVESEALDKGSTCNNPPTKLGRKLKYKSKGNPKTCPS